jgi:hypothetical protein
MSKENKTTIREVESGTIDLVLDEGITMMQFNCSCEDALPFCKAMCCRNRPYYNILLEKDEEDKFDKKEEYPHDLSRHILQHQNGNCSYLDESSKCKLHPDKPRICKSWHCSPEGKGEGITIRDKGWTLIPAQGNAQQR